MTKSLQKIAIRSVLTFMWTLLLNAMFAPVVAQDLNEKDLIAASKRLQNERETVFIQALQLSVSQASVFHAIYVDFDREKNKLDESFIRLFLKYATRYNDLDHELMDEFIKKSQSHQRQEFKIRRKFSTRVSKAISPQLGAQFYEVDDVTSTVLRLNILTGLPFTSSILNLRER